MVKWYYSEVTDDCNLVKPLLVEDYSPKVTKLQILEEKNNLPPLPKKEPAPSHDDLLFWLIVNGDVRAFDFQTMPPAQIQRAIARLEAGEGSKVVGAAGILLALKDFIGATA